MKKLIVLLSACFIVSACSVEHNEKSGSDKAVELTSATYEMIEGCTTGVKKVTGANKAEVMNAFCEMLKNNDKNGNCAAYQRQRAFQIEGCAGTWPHGTPSGMNVSSTQSYNLANESCSAGYHYISSSSVDQGKKAYCRALVDDQRNNNCARSEREKKFREADCKPE